MNPILLGAAVLLLASRLEAQAFPARALRAQMDCGRKDSSAGEAGAQRFEPGFPLSTSRLTDSPFNARALDSQPSVSQSPVPDEWFAADKVRHFFTSALLQSLGYGTLRAMEVEHGSALVGASVVTAGFGIGKELSDRRRGYGFSVRDLVWDAAGAAAVSALLARTER